MSCRQTIISNLVFCVIRQDYVVKERTIQDAYHKLYASSRINDREDAPSREEFVTFIDDLIARFKEYPTEQASLIKKAEKAKNDALPDKRTWLALKHLENTLKFTYDLDLPK